MTESTQTAVQAAQVALVTGASRGIGAAIALELAVRGYQVVGTATTDEGAARISQALSAYPGCRGANLNVNDVAAVEALMDAIVKQQGGLHVLVNNAGITRDTLAMRMKDDDWDAVLDTNLKAVFRLCRAAIRPMMKQRFGRIVNITSGSVKSPIPGLDVSSGARAGLTAFLAGPAREVAQHNVTINNILPGQFETDRLRIATARMAQMRGLGVDEMMAQRRGAIPAKRFGDPREFGQLCAFLASANAGYITGQNFLIDGGLFPGAF